MSAADDVVRNVLQAFEATPYNLSAEALLAVMCYNWEMKIRSISDPEVQQQEERDRNYTIALWRQFATGITLQERQRRLLDAITLEALAIAEETLQLEEGIAEPEVDRAVFFQSPSPSEPSLFDIARQQIFSTPIRQVTGDQRIVETSWWNISPAVNHPSLIFIDGLPISEQEWERNWKLIATDEQVIQQLEQTNVCAEVWTQLVNEPRMPIVINTVLALQGNEEISPEYSPERELTPGAKRGAFPGVVVESPEQQQQSLQNTLTFIDQAQSLPSPAPSQPNLRPAITLNQQLLGEPQDMDICYICQEACVPENVQRLLIQDYENWVQERAQNNMDSSDEAYTDENRNDPRRLIYVLLQSGMVPSEEHAEQYVTAWLSQGLSNAVQNRDSENEVLRYFRVRCSNSSAPHNMQMCRLCLDQTTKRPEIAADRGDFTNMVRALPLLETNIVQLKAACPYRCPKSTIQELYPFDPATGRTYGKPVTCGQQECYKPSKWDDDLIGPYWLYRENICFYKSGYLGSTADNLFVGIVKGYDMDNSVRVSGNENYPAQFYTVEDARYPKRIIVEQVYPAVSKDAQNRAIVQYESVILTDVFPITVLPCLDKQDAQRRFNSLQQALSVAENNVKQYEAAPLTSMARREANDQYLRLRELLAEARASMPQQIEKLTMLLEENKRIGGSSLLLKKRGVGPTIKRESRKTACDICEGVLDKPELVRLYSASQEVSNQCNLQLSGDTDAPTFEVPVVENYEYKKLTPEEKNLDRTHVLHTLLGLHLAYSPNHPLSGPVLEHFRDPQRFVMNTRRQDSSTVFLYVVLLALEGVEVVLSYQENETDINNRIYGYLKTLWDDVFTHVDPSLEWPQVTKRIQYNTLFGTPPYRLNDGSLLSEKKNKWYSEIMRYSTYPYTGWKQQSVAQGSLLLCTRFITEAESNAIRTKRKRAEMGGAPPEQQQQQQLPRVGGISTMQPPMAPSRPGPVAPVQPPPPSSPFAATTRTTVPAPTGTEVSRPPPQQQMQMMQQQQQQLHRSSPFAVSQQRQLTLPSQPSAIVPIAPESLSIPVIPTAGIMTVQAQPPPPASPSRIASLRSRLLQQGTSPTTSTIALPPGPTPTIALPSPPVRQQITMPPPSSTISTRPPLGMSQMIGRPQVEEITPNVGSTTGGPRAIMPPPLSRTAAAVVSPSPLATSLLITPPPLSRPQQQPRIMPSGGSTMTLPPTPPRPQIAAAPSIPSSSPSSTSLVSQRRPPTSSTRPGMTISQLPAITPQLETTVPFWQEWADALAQNIGKGNDSKYIDLARQWLQARLDQVLSSNIASLPWSSIAPTVQQSMISGFRNDLVESNYL